MRILNLACKKCGSRDLLPIHGKTHTKLICSRCGEFIKFANKQEKNIVKYNEERGVE